MRNKAVQLGRIHVRRIPVMERLAVFINDFESIQVGFNAGKRVIVFEARENTRGAHKIRVVRENAYGARKHTRFVRTAGFRRKTLLWRAPPERSYFRVRSYNRS